MFEVIGSFIVTVLGGRLAEQHGLFVQEYVTSPRPYPEPEVALVL